MLKWLLLPISLLVSSPALADEWKPENTRNEIIFQFLSAVDGAQTIYFTQKGIAEEQNPIYGKHPSPEKIVGIKVVGGLTHYLISKELVKRDSKLGRIFQVSTIVVQGGVVAWNAKFVF